MTWIYEAGRGGNGQNGENGVWGSRGGAEGAERGGDAQEDEAVKQSIAHVALVVRDYDLLGQLDAVRINVSIPTDSEEVRRAFEPKAPPLEGRWRALELAKTAHNALPDEPNVNDTLGWIYFKKEKYHEAITALRHSVLKDPKRYDTRFHLGMAYVRFGDLDHLHADAGGKALLGRVPGPLQVHRAEAQDHMGRAGGAVGAFAQLDRPLAGRRQRRHRRAHRSTFEERVIGHHAGELVHPTARPVSMGVGRPVGVELAFAVMHDRDPGGLGQDRLGGRGDFLLRGEKNPCAAWLPQLNAPT